MSTAVPPVTAVETDLVQRPMALPSSRGAVSEAVVRALVGGDLVDLPASVRAAVQPGIDVLTSDDLQLALFCLYELHYGGFEGVDDDLEWSPWLLSARAVIEQAFETQLRAAVTVPPEPAPTAGAVADTLFSMTAEQGGPSLAKYIAKRATLEQAREFLVERTLYTLKEADPHTWAIPRLSGRAKAALVEIQSDEYGAGRPERMHSAIFARTLRAAGLDDSYGAYIDRVSAQTLATLNTMSLFGLHRRLRGAIVGHLAAYEMTSSIPNRLYATGFRRLGFDADATWYFDEHVEADAVHEQIAGRDMAGALVAADPAILPDVLFGAAAALETADRAASAMLDAFTAGRSALRPAA